MPVGKDRQPADEIELSPVALKALPDQLRLEFKKAVDTTDFDTSIELVKQVREEYPSLAAALETMINSYQFDALQKMLEE
jgi:hypothetical protein